MRATRRIATAIALMPAAAILGAPTALADHWSECEQICAAEDTSLSATAVNAGIATAVLIQGADPEMECRADPAEAGLAIKEDGWVPVDESGTAIVVLEGAVAGEVSITCAYPSSDVFWATHADSVALS
ncbi:hypothetical protein [Lolliginicoccus levis]|uniref:hypothetical protein n=1 Tax=Lolliginicoccus levis TaxID=2919542 RepID=UPI0024203777|nr:hypothetical protein [Lolliginicoccus levis]